MKASAIIAALLVAAASASAARLQNDGFESSDFTSWQVGSEGWRVRR